MSSSVSSLVEQCHKTANLAKDGCPAATYAALSPLLEKIVEKATENNNTDFILNINSIINEILNAQAKDDLIRIADFLDFEMVYLLKTYH